jgi:hypothetical protein
VHHDSALHGVKQRQAIYIMQVGNLPGVAQYELKRPQCLEIQGAKGIIVVLLLALCTSASPTCARRSRLLMRTSALLKHTHTSSPASALLRPAQTHRTQSDTCTGSQHPQHQHCLDL